MLISLYGIQHGDKPQWCTTTTTGELTFLWNDALPLPQVGTTATEESIPSREFPTTTTGRVSRPAMRSSRYVGLVGVYSRGEVLPLPQGRPLPQERCRFWSHRYSGALLLIEPRQQWNRCFWNIDAWSTCPTMVSPYHYHRGIGVFQVWVFWGTSPG